MLEDWVGPPGQIVIFRLSHKRGHRSLPVGSQNGVVSLSYDDGQCFPHSPATGLHASH